MNLYKVSPTLLLALFSQLPFVIDLFFYDRTREDVLLIFEIWMPYSFGIIIAIFFTKYFKNLYQYKEAEKSYPYIDVQNVLIALLAIKVVLLIVKIVEVGGVSSYMQGGHLFAIIDGYAQGGGILNKIQTIDTIISIIFLAAIGLSVTTKTHFLYKTYSAVYFIFLPLIELSRSGFLYGLIVFLALYVRMSIFKLGLYIGVLGLTAAVAFGVLRQSNFDDSSLSGSVGQAMEGMVVSEFSSSVNGLIMSKDYVDQYGVLLGKTVLGPVCRMLTFSYFCSDAKNAAEVINYEYAPDAAANGFFVVPTLPGEIYLNFGVIGLIFFPVILLLFLIGVSFLFGISSEQVSLFLIYFSYAIPRITMAQMMTFYLIYLISGMCVRGWILRYGKINTVVK